MNVRHVILDRDGVLNHEASDGGYILSPAQFRWLPGARAALALLHRNGIRISVATNQSAVGRGLMHVHDLQVILAAMSAEAAAAGGPLDAVFYCPHAPEADCECRKPRPGLVNSALQASGIDAADTLLVGDDVRDLEAARQAGVAPVLVRTGKGARTEVLLQQQGVTVPVFDDLLQFAGTLAA